MRSAHQYSEHIHTTVSDAGCIRIHDQADERPGGALMLPNGFGDCTSWVQIGGSASAGEHVPVLEHLEGIELVVHRPGAWLSDHDCRNGYAASVPIGRYRIHRSEGETPAMFWLEHVGMTTPRSAYARVRTQRRGWTLALFAPFTGWTEHDDASLEIATLKAGPGERSIEIYTAGRRLYRLDPGSGDGRCALVRRTDGSLAIRPLR